jgi:hypothetical protein
MRVVVGVVVMMGGEWRTGDSDEDETARTRLYRVP